MQDNLLIMNNLVYTSRWSGSAPSTRSIGAQEPGPRGQVFARGVESLPGPFERVSSTAAEDARCKMSAWSPATIPPATATYNGHNRVTWTTVNSAVNGFQYDAAGNVINDNLYHYLYDAEGRLCAVQDLIGDGVTAYVYDAEGRRVASGALSSWPTSCVNPTNPVVFTLGTSYVLGLGGEQVSEIAVSGSYNLWQHTNVFAGGRLLASYTGNNPYLSGTSTYIALNDWLGTKRAELRASGCYETYSSLPYGDGLNTVSQTCPADATEHHFTGKERDDESGNDYFGARYYQSTMGRFMSPDWSGSPEAVPYADLEKPQSLNLYAYMENNPLSGVDPDGHNGFTDWWNSLWHWVTFRGWYTSQQLVDQHRAWLLEHWMTKDPNGPKVIKGLTDKEVNFAYKCFSGNDGCGAGWNDYIANHAADAIAVAAAFKIPVPGLSGKEGAKDAPSWAKQSGAKPKVGETGKQFAKRLLDAKYGEGNWKSGPATEFNQIQKWADRSFMDPK